jgi:quercetin dioxygenase-like cupin family protein
MRFGFPPLEASLAVVVLLASSAAPRADEPYRAVAEVLTTRSTVVGEPLRYPQGEAELRALVISLRPGEETARHVHPSPLFAYVLEGVLTVDYGPRGERVYRAGDALLEAMQVPHRGKNTGTGPLRILAVFLGTAGTAGTVAVDGGASRVESGRAPK